MGGGGFRWGRLLPLLLRGSRIGCSRPVLLPCALLLSAFALLLRSFGKGLARLLLNHGLGHAFHAVHHNVGILTSWDGTWNLLHRLFIRVEHVDTQTRDSVELESAFRTSEMFRALVLDQSFHAVELPIAIVAKGSQLEWLWCGSTAAAISCFLPPHRGDSDAADSKPPAEA